MVSTRATARPYWDSISASPPCRCWSSSSRSSPLAALQDVGACGGRHPQGLDEDAGQLAHAEEHGQLVRARHPAVVDQHRLVARRPEQKAAGCAVGCHAGTRLLVAVLATGTGHTA